MKSFPIPISSDDVGSIAAGSTLGLEQGLLASAGQPGLTVLAVGYTDTGKVQGVSLGDGNVVEVYANGTDFNAGTVLYREFMSLGEPICFTGLSTGAIITSTSGFYGMSEQLNGSNESPMPLLSYGLSFKETFVYAFRDSSDDTNNRGFINVVNGPLASKVTLTRGNGAAVNADAGSGDPQTDIDVEPWGYLQLQTDGNTEFIIKSTNPVMACIHAEMRSSGVPLYYDSRLVMPLTNDGITWPRSGFVSAPYDNTKVDWYVRDGARSRTSVSIQDTHWEAYFDNQDSAIGVTLTTPSSAPTEAQGQVIWESGGTGTGMSLMLNTSMELELRFSTATATPRLTSSAPLTTDTNYAIVVEFDQTNDLVSLFISSGSTDLTFYTGGGATADSTVVSTATDMCGTGDTGIGAVSSSALDIGGWETATGTLAFQGSIDTVTIGNPLLSTVDRTYVWSTDATTNTTAMIVSPGSFVDFDGATGAADADYEPNGATRVKAIGLISAYSGADSAGLEASPLMPTSAMSQVVAQPFYIADNGDGGNSGVAIASPYEGTAKVYEWNDAIGSLNLAYIVPLTRSGVTITSKEDQNHPASGLIANDGVATNALVGQLNAGVIIADVPITVVAQNGLPTLVPSLRSQNGTTTTSIVNDDDETLMLGWTPATLKAEITEGSDGILYKRVISGSGNTTNDTWEVA